MAMMKIALNNCGKRFNRDWIFRNFSNTFESGQAVAITGANGSGKSTLLQIIGGAIMFNEGSISYEHNQQKISAEQIHQQVSICAPYLELIEEMTLQEFLAFHSQFKPYLEAVTVPFIIEILGLEKAKNKQIRYFSSGMKQRVKLAQCIFSNTAIVLLDEPCTNLDKEGIQQYLHLVNEYCNHRLVIVSSNDPTEYSFCQSKISMNDYK